MRSKMTGILTVLASAAAPFVSWAAEQATLRSAIAQAIVAALLAAKAWTEPSPRKAKAAAERQP